MHRTHLVAVLTLLAACTSRKPDDTDTASETSTSAGTTSTSTPTTGAASSSGKTSEDESCPDEHSYLNNGACYCDGGYQWCDPDNALDVTCCQLEGSTGTD